MTDPADGNAIIGPCGGSRCDRPRNNGSPRIGDNFSGIASDTVSRRGNPASGARDRAGADGGAFQKRPTISFHELNINEREALSREPKVLCNGECCLWED